MEVCLEKGMSEVVRSIPDPNQDIGFQIMSYFRYSVDRTRASTGRHDHANFEGRKDVWARPAQGYGRMLGIGTHPRD